MNRRLIYFTVFFAFAGSALALHAIRATPEQIRQIKRRQSDYSQLLSMKDLGADYSDAVKALQAAGAPRPLGELLADRKADVRERNAEPLINGWVLKSADVIFDDAPLETVESFMRDAENARPLDPAKPMAKACPWRVESCKISAGPVSGRGHAALVMQTIVRGAP